MKAVETTKRNRIGSTVYYSMLGYLLDLSSLIEFGVIVWFSLYECFMMQVGSMSGFWVRARKQRQDTSNCMRTSKGPPSKLK